MTEISLRPAIPTIATWLQSTLLLLAMVMLTACQTSPIQPPQTQANIPLPKPADTAFYHDEIQTMLLLYQQHEEWQSTPYRLGGLSRAGIDCSGFVQLTYRDLFGLQLPRTTIQQATAGRQVSRAELQPGDLIFFRHGQHVGIYLENHKFLHASTTRGVMISSLKNSYWARHYWRAVTILTLPLSQ